LGCHGEFGPRRRNVFSFSTEISKYTGVKINLGKILRDLRKLWKFAWMLNLIFGTTFVLSTLIICQPYSKEKKNTDMDLNLEFDWFYSKLGSTQDYNRKLREITRVKHRGVTHFYSSSAWRASWIAFSHSVNSTRAATLDDSFQFKASAEAWAAQRSWSAISRALLSSARAFSAAPRWVTNPTYNYEDKGSTIKELWLNQNQSRHTPSHSSDVVCALSRNWSTRWAEALISAYSQAASPDDTMVAVSEGDESEEEARGSWAITFTASTVDASLQQSTHQ
jgi:hypothetical protein